MYKNIEPELLFPIQYHPLVFGNGIQCSFCKTGTEKLDFYTLLRRLHDLKC
jgi:hypothetical protein